jgi:hypothetical protein
MTGAFLDTGYIIALEAADDQRHQEAVKLFICLNGTIGPANRPYLR